MSLSITGKATLSKIEENGKFKTAIVRVGKKNQNGEWDSMFFNAKLVGKAKEKATGDKLKANITSAILESNKYNNKTYINILVFDIEVQEQTLEEKETNEYNPFDELPL